jgi:hypothetical protein
MIAAHRRNQPISELQRKAMKARRKSVWWTMELVDLAIAEGREMYSILFGDGS